MPSRLFTFQESLNWPQREKKNIDCEPIEQQLKSRVGEGGEGVQGGMYTGDNPLVEASDFRSPEVISTQRGSSPSFHLGDRKKGFSRSNSRQHDVWWNLKQERRRQESTSDGAEDEAGLLLEALHHLEDKHIDLIVCPSTSFKMFCCWLRSGQQRSEGFFCFWLCQLAGISLVWLRITVIYNDCHYDILMGPSFQRR